MIEDSCCCGAEFTVEYDGVRKERFEKERQSHYDWLLAHKFCRDCYGQSMKNKATSDEQEEA